MTPERWQQIQTIFEAAWQLAGAPRATFLARACAGDHDLEAEVETLLRAEARSGAGEFIADAIGSARRYLAPARPVRDGAC